MDIKWNELFAKAINDGAIQALIDRADAGDQKAQEQIEAIMNIK